MRKFTFLAAIALFTQFSAKAQVIDTAVVTTTTVNTKPLDITNKSGDHLMIQLNNNSWTGAPDSIKNHTKGFSRSASVFVMIDKPFKTNPKYSIALGGGINVSSIYMKNMELGISANTQKMPILLTDSAEHYKKYKFSTTYLEFPVEFRYVANPNMPNQSFKFAVGGRIGTLISAATKGKELQSSTNSAINNTTVKIKDKDYPTSTRLGINARVGYGPFSVFGTYYFTPVFKEGTAPDMKLLQFGICISGL